MYNSFAVQCNKVIRLRGNEMVACGFLGLKIHRHTFGGAIMERQFTFRADDALYQIIQEIAGKERRKMSEIARYLLQRGVSSYLRDSFLFEEDAIKEEKKRSGFAENSTAKTPPRKTAKE